MKTGTCVYVILYLIDLCSQQELLYLEFISKLTSDILTNATRSCSDTSLESLFFSHVTSNKHRLREVLLTLHHSTINLYNTQNLINLFLGFDVEKN